MIFGIELLRSRPELSQNCRLQRFNDHIHRSYRRYSKFETEVKKHYDKFQVSKSACAHDGDPTHLMKLEENVEIY